MKKLIIAIITTALLLMSTTGISAVCFYKGERVTGMYKICYYDCLGSTVAITIGAVQLCPITINK